MSKRKKKNLITMICLLLSLVLLIVFYVWYRNQNATGNKTKEDTEQSNTENTEDSQILASMDPSLINTFHFTNKDADMRLVLKNDIWVTEEDEERPIHQVYVKNMVNLLDEVKAIRVINENPEDIAEYGLKEPSIYVQAVQSDGKTLTLRIGDESGGGQGYYALMNEDKTVYLIDNSYPLGLGYRDVDMTAVDKISTIKAEEIYHIEVIKRDGDDFEIVDDKNNKYPGFGNGLYSWKILKPYEEGYTADSSKVSEKLLQNYTSFNLLNCIDYKGEDLGKYGLDHPVASVLVEYEEVHNETLEEPQKDPNTGQEITEVTTKEEKSIKIHIGNVDMEGNYFIRREGSNAVYTMKMDEVDKMLQVDAFSIMSSFIQIPNIEHVDRIEIQIEDKTYTMEIKRETGKNASGEEEKKATYYYNGTEVEEDIFKDVYQIMISAGYDVKIKEEINREGRKPYLTISYHLNQDGKKVNTTSYLPYSESFYLVDSGNRIRFFADKRDIDAIAEAIQEFKRTE